MSFVALQLGPYPQKVRMPAFAEGVRACGGTVVEVPMSAPETLVRTMQATGRPWFAFTSGHLPREAAARGILRACNIPLLVLDLGYLRRASSPKSEDGYYQVGLGRLCWLPGEGEWDAAPAPDQVSSAKYQVPSASAPAGAGFTKAWADARLRALKVDVAERIDPASRPEALLVLGQKPCDGQHGMDAPLLESWLTEAAAEYYARGWRVLLRPHPRYQELRLTLPHELLTVGEAITDQFARVREVLTVNSTAGVEALIAGLPVRSHTIAHYFPLGRNPARADVVRHLRKLASAQWTVDEMRAGTALRFMARFLPVLPGTECVRDAADVCRQVPSAKYQVPSASAAIAAGERGAAA